MNYEDYEEFIDVPNIIPDVGNIGDITKTIVEVPTSLISGILGTPDWFSKISLYVVIIVVIICIIMIIK